MRIVYENECTASDLSFEPVASTVTHNNCEYRECGYTLKDESWCWRLTRVAELIVQIFPGCIAGIFFDWDHYVQSLQVLAGEVFTGQERTTYFVRTFSENISKNTKSLLYSVGALKADIMSTSCVPANLLSAKCLVSLLFDEKKIFAEFVFSSPLPKTQLSEKIEQIGQRLKPKMQEMKSKLQSVFWEVVTKNSQDKFSTITSGQFAGGMTSSSATFSESSINQWHATYVARTGYPNENQLANGEFLRGEHIQSLEVD